MRVGRMLEPRQSTLKVLCPVAGMDRHDARAGCWVGSRVHSRVRALQLIWTRPMLVQAAGVGGSSDTPHHFISFLSRELHAGPQTWPDPAALEDGRGPCKKMVCHSEPIRQRWGLPSARA